MTAERDIAEIKRAVREILDARLGLNLDGLLLMVGLKIGMDTRFEDVQVALGQIAEEDRAA